MYIIIDRGVLQGKKSYKLISKFYQAALQAFFVYTQCLRKVSKLTVGARGTHGLENISHRDNVFI